MSKQSRRPNRAARHRTPPPIGTTSGSRPSKNLYWLGALVVAAGLIVAATVIGKGGNANAAGPIKVGAVAPPVRGIDVVSGRTISSKQFAGKPILYYLSEGVMCQACLVQIQALQQQAAVIRDGGLQLVSVTNDDPGTLRQAAEDYKITTPLLADTSRAIVKSFGVLGGIPFGVGMHNDTADHTFILVDRSGHVRYIRDFPKMWIGVNELLKQLPTVS
jgi:peroxiredoxin